MAYLENSISQKAQIFAIWVFWVFVCLFVCFPCIVGLVYVFNWNVELEWAY